VGSYVAAANSAGGGGGGGGGQEQFVILRFHYRCGGCETQEQGGLAKFEVFHLPGFGQLCPESDLNQFQKGQ
jgi:hypothetical protein